MHWDWGLFFQIAGIVLVTWLLLLMVALVVYGVVKGLYPVVRGRGRKLLIWTGFGRSRCKQQGHRWPAAEPPSFVKCRRCGVQAIYTERTHAKD